MGASAPCSVAVRMSDEPPDAPDGADEPDDASAATAIRAQRLAKIERLRAEGIVPYPPRFDRDQSLTELRRTYGHLEAGDESEDEVRVAGRLMLKREQGKLTFATIRDRDGEIQLFVSLKEIGDEAFARFSDLDRGDWVGVTGTPMVTRKGELSVRVGTVELLAKALRPLPDKWKGLTDIDQRYRQRYVDLVVNEDARRILDVRVAAVAAIRETLNGRGFIEVETPMLNMTQGGATALPFVTRYNALGIDTFLRLALELPLKRLIVGGMERVFEIGRVFRNEGLDTRHNPEFTMLETYAAFEDYTDMMALTEEVVSRAASAAIGRTEISVRGQAVDLAPPWRRVSMAELITETLGVTIHSSMEQAEARAVLDGLGLGWKPSWGSGRLTYEVYDELVEGRVDGPVIVLDYPREISPLAKPHRDDPNLVERFEVIIGGRELANAYSELNDPVEQLARFRDEARAKAAGDPEAGDVDLDYVRALEYGMPPAGGMGMGIDRLIMLLAEVDSIREVILFPTLRPEAGLTDADFAPPAATDPD